MAMVAHYAQCKHDVMVIDTNPGVVDTINSGEFKSSEPGVTQILKQHNNITASTDYDKVKETTYTLIMLPSPSDTHDKFVSTYVERACKSLAKALKGKQSPHFVVVCSTLMPGTMDKKIAPIFKGEGMDKVHLYHSPVFIALGNVLKGLRKPDAIIIGEQEALGALCLQNLYKATTDDETPIIRTSYVNAELAKLLLNCFITSKIALANTCADICEQIPGADANQILSFMGLDSRIGSKVMKPGLGYGGTCFPRDDRALLALCKDIGMVNHVQQGIHVSNDKHDLRVLMRILRKAKVGNDNPVVAMLGLTYKTDVDLVDESNALSITRQLAGLGVTVRAYDPKGVPAAKAAFTHANLTYCDSVEECVTGSDLAVLATPWPEFATIAKTLKDNMRTPAVLDCWSMWDFAKFESMGIRYHAVGRAD